MLATTAAQRSSRRNRGDTARARSANSRPASDSCTWLDREPRRAGQRLNQQHPLLADTKRLPAGGEDCADRAPPG